MQIFTVRASWSFNNQIDFSWSAFKTTNGTLSLQVINSGSRSFVFTVSGLGSVSQFQPVLIDDKKNLHLETKLQYQVVYPVRQLRGRLWHRTFRDGE